MVEGPEHRNGWSRTIEVDGERVRIEARHVSHPRLPRGHEIARQAARGRPYSMVEETRYEWAVVAGHRLVASLQQLPSGDFHVGALRTFSRMGIEEAAAEAWRMLGPGRFRKAPDPSPDAATEPPAAPGVS